MAEAKTVKVLLDRTFTGHGEHYGPGIVEVTQDIADTLKAGQKRAKDLDKQLAPKNLPGYDMASDNEARVDFVPAQDGVVAEAIEGGAGTEAADGQTRE